MSELSTEQLLQIIGENTPGRINLNLGDLDMYLGVARAAIKAAHRVPVSTSQQSAQRASVEEGEVEYELYEVSGEDVLMVAGTSGKRAYEEILHYAAQYAQDGPVEIHKLVRTKLSIPVAAPSPAPQGEQA
jgi:hypothetical protein